MTAGPRRDDQAVAHLVDAGIYESRPIKRDRRTRAEIQGIRQSIFEVLQEIRPATVRQSFYQLVTRNAIAKTEAEYKTVVRLLTEMRRAREIPFGWIADNTRWMRKPTSYCGLDDLLLQSQRFYRRAIWDKQTCYVEVWLEKDALSGVLYDVTAEFDVPLMVTRGYPSVSYLHTAAEAITAQGKPTFLYYFGDHDPSGVDIPRKVEEDLRAFAPGAEIHFERVAVTSAQIRHWNLPTRPTKKTDSRSKNFEGESVEVDAIPPEELRRIARECIESHIDQDELGRMQTIEQEERETLARWALGFRGAA